ncbi:MAG: multifunctional CCA addition/repair protein [Gammaproteobacteria bacterium]|nr:MAG: multifunctional CCA addition/repair protein [Gammaproteobacteria bacterium]
MKQYLVGGAVRDKLLNLPIKDRDWVVVGASPDDMLQQGFLQVGKDFPVFLHPDTKEEYALARTERKQGKGYTGFACYAGKDVSLSDDLRRRDLTINAMAESDTGEIIDPYNGQIDLQHKKLRHVSAAFSEDPLRVLRVARFCARYQHLGFTVADETQALMQAIADSGELADLTPERVWQETERALLENTPTAFFQTLQDCGALQVLFADLSNLFGVPQTAKHHPEIDTGIHTLMVLEQAVLLTTNHSREEQLQVRWAAITHDLGKGKTPEHILPSHHGHEAISEHLVDKLNKKYRIPKSAARMAKLVAKYHTHSHRAFELKPATVMRLFEALDSFRRKESLPLFLLACKADAKGRAGFESSEYPQADYLQDCLTAAQQINAQQIIQMQDLRGAALGEELRKQRINAIKKVKHDYVSEP